MMSMPFVGREELLHAIEEGLSSDTDLTIEVIEGLPGSGKTTLLEELCRRVGGGGLSLDMTKFTFRDRAGERESSAVQGSFFQYKQFLLELAKGAGGLDGFESVVNSAWKRTSQLQSGDVHLTQDADHKGELTNPTQSVQTVTIAAKVTASSWRSLAEEITDAFVARWEVWSTGYRARTGRNLLVGLDNYDEVLHDEVIRSWLRSLGSRMCNVVFVVTRVPSDTQLDVQGPIKARLLPNFTADEVRQCLEGGLEEEVSPEVVQQVHKFTEGHPQMVGLLCDFLSGSELGRNPDELRKQLRQLPADRAAKVSELVKKILEHPENPEQLVEAAYAACVLRTFTAPVLAALLGDSRVDAHSLVKRLNTYTITEKIEDEGGDSYRLRTFIRRWLRKDLFERDKGTTFWQLNRQAADYFKDQLFDTEARDDNVSGVYGDWRLYEDLRWQSLKREWLYYLAHAGTGGLRMARLQFARLFLDAFWWWGCYLDFEFCTAILDDLKDVLRDDVDGRKLAANLSKILDLYPKGWDKRPGPDDTWSAPDWKTVRAALKQVIDACGLRREAQRTTAEQRHVYGLCCVFLAHSYRFDDPAAPEIDEYYADASAVFEEADDPWTLGFLTVERADVALERGDVQGALQLANDAAELATRVAQEDQPDEELNANIERVRADAFWLRERWQAAVDRSCRAVTHAYLFQNHDGSGPDLYTRTFYDEQQHRLAAKLEEAVRAGDESVLAAVHARLLAAPLAGRVSGSPPESPAAAPELRGGACLQLVRELFPPGPTTDVLRQNDSPFVAEWQEYEERVDSAAGVDVVVVLDDELETATAD